MGGTSSERDVSLVSGQNVADALASLGKYEVVPVVLDEDNLSAMPAGVSRAYIALHGGWGESGGVQAALDQMKIPYTGPGAEASRVAMDKVKTKMILEMKNIPTARWTLASSDTAVPPMPLPVVVKPPCDGSSVGISKVSTAAEWIPARDAAFEAVTNATVQPPTSNLQPTILVEEYIPGREYTVGVIDGEPLPVIEIVAKGGWYGYEEKYNSDETCYPFVDADPAPGAKALSAKLQRLAVDAYEAIGCRGVTRVDFRVSPLGRAYVLELNTSPGFTAHSLVPQAGMHTGLTLAQVCDRILSTARCD